MAAWPRCGHAAFEETGAGARAPGMGDAFVAVADDVYSVYYNPAGLGTLERPQAGTSYSRLFMGLSDNSNLSTSFVAYAHPLYEGRHGAVGTAWNSFALSGLYRENSYYLSYGRPWLRHPRRGTLHIGASAKYLQRSFGDFPEAQSSMSGLQVLPGQADPVLSGSRSRGVLDADLGLLHRWPQHFALGLQVTHVPQPNVAFSPNDTDRLPLGVKLGFNYRSLISNLAAQYDTQTSPTGTRDHLLTFGAERWFPRLFVGDFGARGALAWGTRDFAQLSMGLSYRTHRLGLDYAFAMPIQTVAATAGSHKFGVNFRFGRPTDDEESLEMLLEAMRQLKAGASPTRVQASGRGLTPGEKAQVDEYLAQARGLESVAHYKQALDKLSAALGVAPADKELITAFGRLNYIAQQIGSLPGFKQDPVQAALHQGILAFLAGNNPLAVQRVSEALAYNPRNRELDVFLSSLEKVTGLRRSPAATTRPLRYDVAERLTKAESALQERHYQEAAELALDILREDAGNAGAWEILGTARFAQKDLAGSLSAWRKAYQYEKSPAFRSAIKGYIRSIERALAQPSRRAAAERAPARLPELNAEQTQTLYYQAVDHYTRREFLEAKEKLETILRSYPEHEEARKALRRVQEELR